MSQGSLGLRDMGGLPMFMLAMLISGSLNTLLMKFMVMQKVPTGPGAQGVAFDHPYLCSLFMMLGELLCLGVYYVTNSREADAVKEKSAPKHIFMIACLLDWTATTLVNMAYLMIAASVVQMTRGAIVIFTCIFSVVFLGRRQYAHHIVGVFLVFVGITLVSLSTYFNPTADASQGTSAARSMMGISLCVGAQIFQASMLVYEEKIMAQYSVPPLQVVGLEGFFGTVFGLLLVCLLNFLHIESTPEALYQVSHSTPLLISIVGSIFSIAVFNYSGISVTQKASAVSRSTIDVSRTVLIWMAEMFLGWNTFNPLQLVGFVILALGTLLYNRLLVVPALEPPPEVKGLLGDKMNV
mmetsp:Transcript_1214/g.3050  ORF Transcript_1214/g.3050 Transcript_1214/m.3050 type:complete len:353 (+) Transcript_1214:77-1135(+)|eukprot:CAMPEP_0195085656 /NCGR_PEP_ID=MMETSP0448-20130528/26012_1 /TAXON_ID=66468 /ORGANISM="Heterocapsa triquestra, Strain CCMP 448" /LENGTH=352 /DNA_ID=CAMNT_0040119061 /DNA_START=70 /DNA_END=1128 /DNA_ORIENTATION=-